jgi:anti-anti-sigma regulatory factor
MSTDLHTADVETSNDPLRELLAQATYRSAGIGTNLYMHLEPRGDLLVLHISGTSSDSLPESFTGAVEQLLARLRPKHAVVDLTASLSLPSVVLAFLVFFHKNAEAQGSRKVILYGANTRILTVIKMIGMLDFFVIATDESALNKLISQ